MMGAMMVNSSGANPVTGGNGGELWRGRWCRLHQEFKQHWNRNLWCGDTRCYNHHVYTPPQQLKDVHGDVNAISCCLPSPHDDDRGLRRLRLYGEGSEILYHDEDERPHGLSVCRPVQ